MRAWWLFVRRPRVLLIWLLARIVAWAARGSATAPVSSPQEQPAPRRRRASEIARRVKRRDACPHDRLTFGWVDEPRCPCCHSLLPEPGIRICDLCGSVYEPASLTVGHCDACGEPYEMSYSELWAIYLGFWTLSVNERGPSAPIG